MSRDQEPIVDDEEPLVDTTATIPLHSKRTERLQKKEARRKKKHDTSTVHHNLLELPIEILLDILSLLRPSDLFCFSSVSRSTSELVFHHEASLTRAIIDFRYPVLARCFPLPVELDKVNAADHGALLHERRQQMLQMHKKPYQHVQPIDPLKLCTCLTCVLAWNNLCLILDFNHYQGHLDKSEPLPVIPRGRLPEWNQEHKVRKAAIVETAIREPLWYARILQAHLDSTTRSIVRHSRARGKVAGKTPLFQLTAADVSSGTDAFAERSGPPSYEFPYHRDNYYLLEAYLPNRRWDKEQRKWFYYPNNQHLMDLEFVKRQVKAWEQQEKMVKGG